MSIQCYSGILKHKPWTDVFFRSLGKGPGGRFHGLFAWTVLRKAGSQGFMWPFSRVQQWQWLVHEWLLGYERPICWAGSNVNGISVGIFLCVSWFDPANNLLIFWYFGDDIDTARPTKLAKPRISSWTWPTVHNFLHPRCLKKNRKTARCFPTSYTVNRVITAISRFFVTPVKPISFRPSIGSGAGAISLQSSELSSGSADGGVFGCVWELSQRSKGCRLVQDAGVVMVGVGVWVEKIEKNSWRFDKLVKFF